MATMLSCAKAAPQGPAAKITAPQGPAAKITAPQGPAARMTGPQATAAKIAGPQAAAARRTGPRGPAAGTPGLDGPAAEEAEPDGPHRLREPEGSTVRVEQVRPTVFQLTLGAFDLAALIAGARWAAAGGGPRGELPPKTLEQLRSVLDRFDEQWRRI